MQYGIMQGRLSPKEPHLLQSFPWDNWEIEFDRARSVGFSRIEWLFDKPDWDKNPIMSSHGRSKIVELMDSTNINVSTLCAHYFIGGELLSTNRKVRTQAIEVLRMLINAGLKIGVDTIVLPFFDNGDLHRFEIQALLDGIFAELVKVVSETEVKILIESELSSAKLFELMSSINNDKIGLCYDLGNATSLGFDVLAEFKELYPYIYEVHVKDKKINAGSVMLGEGDTPIKDIINFMQSMNFISPVILETPVGTNWKIAAQKHFEFLSG